MKVGKLKAELCAELTEALMLTKTHLLIFNSSDLDGVPQMCKIERFLSLSHLGRL